MDRNQFIDLEQEVDVKKREPINDVTQIKDIYDMPMYAQKKVLEGKTGQNFETLRNDVNKLDEHNGNTNIEDITVPETLANFIGISKV